VKRREFISLLGGAAAAWPLAARGQQPAIPVVGYLSSVSPEPEIVAAFRRGLGESGFVEGQNVAIDYRWAEGRYDRLSAFGNVTGVSTFSSQLGAKRLELLQELMPQASVIAVLTNPIYPTTESQVKEVQEAAAQLGMQPVVLAVSTEPDMDAAFATLPQKRAGGLVVGVDAFLFSHRNQIAALAARYRMPAVYAWREFAAAGGLMSYGISRTDAYQQVGVYAGRILKGAKPADLPVMQPTKFELVINLKTAKALGLQIPDKLLALADEVIE
jgi:ABC-type uncharacterized transport system substrate-binding protein